MRPRSGRDHAEVRPDHAQIRPRASPDQAEIRPVRALLLDGACVLACCADRAGPDADLDDVSAVDDEVLRHLVGHLRRARARARARVRVRVGAC